MRRPICLLFIAVAPLVVPTVRAADPLPSWNDGKAKQVILDFVAKVTNEGSPEFVPIADRIAVFDNDGTLWCEQPMYVQLAFAIDRVQGPRPAASRMADDGAVRLVAQGRLQGRARRR